MELRKHHIYIALGILLFGGLVQLAKRNQPNETADANFRIALNRLDEKPYARTADTGDEDAQKQFKIAREAAPTVHYAENNTFSHPTPAAQEPTPTPSSSASATEDDKKKKKKKKRKDLSVAMPAAKPLPEDVAIKKNTDTNRQQTTPLAAPLIQKPALPNYGSYANRPNAISIDEWERKLLSQPDSTATQNFIKMFKSGSVTPQVFYQIAKQMLADSRQEMQALGVTALTSTKSVQSFTMLAGYIEKNPSTPAGQKAQTELNTYSKTAHLGILEDVLRSQSTSNAGVQAANMISTLATQLTQSLQSQTAGGNRPTQLIQTYTNQFAPLRTLLTRLSTVSANSQMASSAGRALSAIESLLQV